ncbi:MAG: FkbM family methyltransferase, partial [Bacteroidetes bacterium]|nr:FkbM family methyltransferase [Bacteroidota bacterium]
MERTREAYIWRCSMPTARSILKRLYEAVPFKQPVFQMVRRVVSLPEPVYRHLHFKGIIDVPISPTAGFRIRHHGYMIENELFWNGFNGWEKISMELWTRLSRNAQVIVDIGANTGVYALAAAAMQPDALVIAVEPVRRIYDKLADNASLNGGRIKTVHAAASSRSGVAVLYDLPEREHVLSVSLDPEWNKESAGLKPVEVPAITVADLLVQHGATRVDLLKIDVETYEAEVLRGFLEILHRDRPSMLIEILNEKVAAEVGSIL